MLSFEFFPTKTEEGRKKLIATIEHLAELEPGFVSVTYGAGGGTRDATVGIASEIQNRIGLEAVVHLTCTGHTVAEIEDVLKDMESCGLDNVLALRGDPPEGEERYRPERGGLSYADELVRFIRKRHRLCIGAACYPETHTEAPDAGTDLANLARKVNSGVDFLITQLFFDNAFYFDFVKRARALGIHVPIVAGIMPVTNVAQIEKFTKLCGATIPEELRLKLDKVREDEQAVMAIGIEWALQQCRDLVAAGVPGIHFYTLNKSLATRIVHLGLQDAIAKSKRSVSMVERGECTYDPLVELMSRFENVKAVDASVDAFAGLTVEEALQKHIVDGIKKSLEAHIDAALEKHSPLQLINEVLLAGMKTVGELFGAGQMQLPFVLQSAEVMKAAIRYVEPKLDRVEGTEKGSILLATVAGDVHDIGKNLVDIILSNNGYRVVNIGIKQPINSILAKAEEHGVHVIGMSGLLVKSTLVMRENLQEMNVRGLAHIPVILGGAALTRAYVEEDLRAIYEGSVYYAKDAFEGLSLMEKLSAPDHARPEPSEAHRVRSHRLPDSAPELYVWDGVKSSVAADVEPPKLPFYGAKRRTDFHIFEIYKYVNPVALWRNQWQFRRPDGMSNPDFTEWLEENVRPIFERKQRELANVIRPAVKWGYFWAQSEGNDLIVYEEDARTERCRFRFPRQAGNRRLCISDFFRSRDSGVMDVAGLTLVTVGREVSQHERKLFADGDFQEYLYTHGMGVETAEALAEYWHKQVRHELGIDDREPEDVKGLFAARYHGCRYSFGYPACPNVEDQTKLFALLEPADIGVELTEEFMLDPEQSTSAIVVHHPEAGYFNV